MRFKNAIMLLTLAALTSGSYAQGVKYQLLIGSYNTPAKPEGIYVYDFNTQTGELNHKTTTNAASPSYLAVSPDRKHVYAVSEDQSQSVNAFGYNSASGKLTFLNKQDTGGGSPTYVSIDATGKYVFVANYAGGNFAAVPVLKDGSLGTDIQYIKHEGSSVNRRQTKPFAHSTVISPDNKYLFVSDLGIDKINIYKFDPKKSPSLSPSEPAFVSLAPGSGPRHFTFHPNKKFAYLIQEINGTITAFDYKDGNLKILQTVSIVPEGFTGRVGAADIHVSPDGKFLYGSNRGDANDLSIYAINQTDGKLTFVGRQSTLGKTPRNFAIDPTGNFLLAANQDSNDIFVFKRNQKTGLLTPTGQKITISKPSCLQFVRVD
ncbi:MAG TPA: 3-carboxymuconate cyclase [Sphingobacteriaceae bacterium]|nr:3-carboxymuconate cyclase [Sphingobacteriaceae bacterium]